MINACISKPINNFKKFCVSVFYTHVVSTLCVIPCNYQSALLAVSPSKPKYWQKVLIKACVNCKGIGRWAKQCRKGGRTMHTRGNGYYLHSVRVCITGKGTDGWRTDSLGGWGITRRGSPVHGRGRNEMLYLHSKLLHLSELLHWVAYRAWAHFVTDSRLKSQGPFP